MEGSPMGPEKWKEILEGGKRRGKVGGVERGGREKGGAVLGRRGERRREGEEVFEI